MTNKQSWKGGGRGGGYEMDEITYAKGGRYSKCVHEECLRDQKVENKIRTL